MNEHLGNASRHRHWGEHWGAWGVAAIMLALIPLVAMSGDHAAAKQPGAVDIGTPGATLVRDGRLNLPAQPAQAE